MTHPSQIILILALGLLLTAGPSGVAPPIEFIPLFPSQPLPHQAWSEFRYWAYCYVMPQIK